MLEKGSHVSNGICSSFKPSRKYVLLHIFEYGVSNLSENLNLPYTEIRSSKYVENLSVLVDQQYWVPTPNAVLLDFADKNIEEDN